MCAVSPQPGESPPHPQETGPGVLITYTDTPRESPLTPRKLAQGSSSLAPTPPGLSAPRLPSPMNLGNWTFRESRDRGSGLGVAWSSRVPGKFWALTACLQR